MKGCERTGKHYPSGRAIGEIEKRRLDVYDVLPSYWQAIPQETHIQSKVVGFDFWKKVGSKNKYHANKNYIEQYRK